MSRTAVADRLVAELRRLPPGTNGGKRALKAAIGCSMEELQQAINRLRYAGKLEFDRLELRPSMREDPESLSSPPGGKIRSGEDDDKGEPAAGDPPVATGSPTCEQHAVRDRGGLPEERNLGPDAQGQARHDPAGAGRAAADPDIPAPDRPELNPEGERSTPAKARATARAPGGEEAQPPSSGARPADGGHKRALPPTPPRGTAAPARGGGDLQPDPHPTGPELHAEILAWCRRTGAAVTNFSKAALGSSGSVHMIAAAARPRPATIARVRDFIVANPDGLPVPAPAPVRPARPAPAPPSPRPEPEVARAVVAEAEQAAARRRRAKCLGGGSSDPLPLEGGLTLGEQFATLLVAEPRDLFAAVRRKHPESWERILRLARARNERPGVTLFVVLEAGLSALGRRRDAGDRQEELADVA